MDWVSNFWQKFVLGHYYSSTEDLTHLITFKRVWNAVGSTYIGWVHRVSVTPDIV